MIDAIRQLGRLLIFSTVATLGGTCRAADQSQPQSSSDLIKYLTYQSDRPSKHGLTKGDSPVFSCGPSLGEARDDRAITIALVKMGAAAVPAIEDAIASVEALGDKSEFARKISWLLFAYARIKGAAAFPKLNRMVGNINVAPYAISLDYTMALALGLTSFVSPFREDWVGTLTCPNGFLDDVAPCDSRCIAGPLTAIHCDRGGEPKDAMDELILAWELDCPKSLEKTLGPIGRHALDEMSAGRSLTSLKSEFEHGRQNSGGGIGYRFLISGRWSAPDETLEDEQTVGRAQDDIATPEIDTIFTNGSSECGRFRVRFSSTPRTRWPTGPRQYAINNADLRDLLHVIASCRVSTELRR